MHFMSIAIENSERGDSPTAAIIDSQNMKSAERSSPAPSASGL